MQLTTQQHTFQEHKDRYKACPIYFRSYLSMHQLSPACTSRKVVAALLFYVCPSAGLQTQPMLFCHCHLFFSCCFLFAFHFQSFARFYYWDCNLTLAVNVELKHCFIRQYLHPTTLSQLIYFGTHFQYNSNHKSGVVALYMTTNQT